MVRMRPWCGFESKAQHAISRGQPLVAQAVIDGLRLSQDTRVEATDEAKLDIQKMDVPTIRCRLVVNELGFG
tara:strand:+ start:125 stop:340 length:216 start_codon:yes stop_codon:yes gene_type:complete